MNRNTPRLSIAARRRIVEAVQRIERPMSRRVVGNAALNDGIDRSCQHCGYQLCNCGPCATCGEVPYYCNGTHAYEPTKPSARALDNLPPCSMCSGFFCHGKCAEGTGKPAEPSRVWRVGDRVRVVGAPFDGRVGAVSQITRFATFVVHLDGPKEGTQEYYHSADGSDLVAEPSPAGGRDPYEAAGHPWARVGMRVRCTVDAGLMTKGREYEVIYPSGACERNDAVTLKWGRNAGGAICGTWCLEPAPSPVSESPAAGEPAQ